MDWRNASPNIVRLWWDVDDAVKQTIRSKGETETHGLHFSYQSKMLFITLPSGRKLCYAHPQIGEELLKRFQEACKEVGVVDKPAKMEGRSMVMFISPKASK